MCSGSWFFLSLKESGNALRPESQLVDWLCSSWIKQIVFELSNQRAC